MVAKKVHEPLVVGRRQMQDLQQPAIASLTGCQSTANDGSHLSSVQLAIQEWLVDDFPEAFPVVHHPIVSAVAAVWIVSAVTAVWRSIGPLEKGLDIAELDAGAVRHGVTGRDETNQLTDVARPVIIGEHRESLARELLGHTVPAVEDAAASAPRSPPVVPALAQWRNREMKVPEPEEQIVAEATGHHQVIEWPVRRRDHPRVG